MASKQSHGKDKNETLSATRCVADVFTTFWCVLFSTTEHMQSNMKSICFT